jgi:hypothetical protein
VKRVVTVKQVQPFRLAGPGHGYAVRRGASLGGAKALRLGSRAQVQGLRRLDRGGSAVSGLLSVLCHLISGLARLGLGVGELDEKGIWWMPWHREAMKDVARCEKLRRGASARGP